MKNGDGGRAGGWLTKLGLGVFVSIFLGFTAVAAVSAAAAVAAPVPQDFGFVQPRFESVDSSDVIPDGVITALVQDKQGFIWIGTPSGLVRFDGYRLRLFAHIESDPATLGGEHVVALAAARDGRLWVGTASHGVSVFDPVTERFTRLRHQADKSDSISPGRIWTLLEDEQGGMWFGTDHGLDYLAPRQTRFRHLRHPVAGQAALPANRILSLCLDRNKRLWVGSAAGLQRVSLDRQHLEAGHYPELATQSIESLFQAADGKLWVGTAEHGAAWLAPDNPKPNWLQLRMPKATAKEDAKQQTKERTPQIGLALNQRIASIAQPYPGQIWLATEGGGIVIVSASTGELLQQVRHDMRLPGSLAHDVVWPLFKDRSGLLWIGTRGAGLQWFDSRASMTTRLQHGKLQKNGLSQAEVTRVLELADGRLLFGLDGNGIDIFDRKTGRVGAFRPEPGGLPNGVIRGLVETADGSLWVGMRSGGVVRRPRGSTRWQAVAGVPGKEVRAMLRLRDGGVLLGTNEGVTRWPGQSPTDGPARFASQPGESAMPNRITALLEEMNGDIWVGTENGLWHWQAGTGQWRGMASRSQNSLPSGFIHSLLLDRTGRLWVASDSGLLRRVVAKPTSADAGLAPSQPVAFENINLSLNQQGRDLGHHLLEDAQGRIWTGHVVIDPARGSLYSLRRADGMEIGTGILGSAGKTTDGLLIFGGPNGATIIDAARFEPRHVDSPLVITSLQIDGLPSPPETVLQVATPQLTLKPGQHSFAIEFALLDFADPKRNRYQYRLQGVDKDWLNSDVESRLATYANLWPGSYTLHVRTSSQLGQWHSQQLAIPVRVLPLLWQTPGFMALALLLSVWLVYALHRWRVRHLRLQADRLQLRIDARVADILKISQIGQELTATLDIEQAMAQVYRQIETRLDASVFLIGMVNKADHCIDFAYMVEYGQRLPAMSIDLHQRSRPAVWCVREQRELILQQRAQLQLYVGEVLPPMTGSAMETVVYLPLRVNDEVIGCLSVQSPKQAAYLPEQLEFLRILASYTAIALSNSVAHSELYQSHAELAAALNRVQETRSKLVQAEKMASLGNLVVGIAHEINTPLGTTLTAISGVASVWDTMNNVISGSVVSKAALLACAQEGAEYTDLAAKSATRAADLINSFKAIAVHDDDTGAQELDLTQYLNGHALLQESLLDAAGCMLRLDLPPSLVCHSLPDALGLALAPIFANWLDHAFVDGRTGTARVGAHLEASGDVIIDMSDDGWGILPDDLPKVFDPFFTTRSGMGGHIGLGLHVAFNQVTERLKGEISITSTVGAGTTVRIRLHGVVVPETTCELPD